MADEIALTPDQVMEQLKTRGFTTGNFGTPLRHFRGVLDSITGAMVQRGQMAQARLEVTYHFSKIEVFSSIEPYPTNVGEISLLHSNTVRSNMGVLGKSMDKILNAGVDENAGQDKVSNQDALIGKVQEWKMTSGHMFPYRDDATGLWGERPNDAWEVQYVEGIGGTPHSGAGEAAPATPAVAAVPKAGSVTPMQQALNLLNGKTAQEWNNVVFQDPIIKGDPQLTNSIIQGTFLSGLVAAGTVTVDADGRHTVV